MMDEIERDIEVLSHGWLAAVCAIAFLAAAFIFASWAVSCHAGELIPLDGVWAIDPDRPSHFIVSKTDKGTIVYDTFKGNFTVEPPSSVPWTRASDGETAGWITSDGSYIIDDSAWKHPSRRTEEPTASWEGSFTGTGTVEGLVEGLAEAASTGDVDITWNVGTDTIATPADHQVLTFQLPPKDGQVLMYNGTAIEWVYTEPETTKEKGGIMGFYFPIVQIHWVIFGFLAIVACIYLGAIAVVAWVNDREPKRPKFTSEYETEALVGLSVLTIILLAALALAWPFLYPALAIYGALYATRSVIRLKKSVSQKSELGHTHDE